MGWENHYPSDDRHVRRFADGFCILIAVASAALAAFARPSDKRVEQSALGGRAVMATRAPVYRPSGWQSEADRRRAYDQTKARHYTKARRYHLRNAYLATHPLCECGCNGVASVVDHKQPHNGDDALLYAWENPQAMTKQRHDRKTATHDGGFGNRINKGTDNGNRHPSTT